MYVKENRTSSYVGTFVTSNKGDMDKLTELRKSISLLNKTDAFGRYNNTRFTKKKRVCAKGRKAIVKMKTAGSKGPVQYEWGGNIVGGISNAAELDVYIYDDHSTYWNATGV